MKKLETLIVAVAVAALVLGGQWAINYAKEAKDPELKAKRWAEDIMADLKDMNKDIDDLYAYQAKSGIKVKKQRAIIVPEDLLKPKPKLPVKPAVANTTGVKKP